MNVTMISLSPYLLMTSLNLHLHLSYNKTDGSEYINLAINIYCSLIYCVKKRSCTVYLYYREHSKVPVTKNGSCKKHKNKDSEREKAEATTPWDAPQSVHLCNKFICVWGPKIPFESFPGLIMQLLWWAITIKLALLVKQLYKVDYD